MFQSVYLLISQSNYNDCKEEIHELNKNDEKMKRKLSAYCFALDFFPDDVVVICLGEERHDWVRTGWSCFLEYPFTILCPLPFPPLIAEFFSIFRFVSSQLLPLVWKIFYW